MLPPPGLVSPVPAYTVPSGAAAIAPIEWVTSAGQVVVNVDPKSVECHTPAVEVATYRPPLFAGSIAASTTRPPTTFGPRNCQAAWARAGSLWAVAARIAAAWSAAASNDLRTGT